MAEDEGILARWSRLKAQAKDETQEASTPESTNDAEATPGAAATEPTPDAEDAPDLSHLPALDSIDATTDLRGFLAAGVPTSLRNAALRRAWSADPAIRDFIGPNENFWDHTAGSVPGFRPLAVDAARRLLGQLVDEEPRGDTVEAPPAALAQVSIAAPPVGAQTPLQTSAGTEPEQAGVPSDEAPESSEPDARQRHHGSATPRFD
ncbi:DUF3306 domain-containing protein [Pseudaminobacter salicylatoxidans]|uniref:DUF3306 domain-containing protein n=1 Tax=Pseudaminobacter salicylatoxidans TaxID=93369 RepID=UPI0002F5A1B5|nr:DUF3306 domain-containing protein [Pseudaminobacter salicylatoxidans]